MKRVLALIFLIALAGCGSKASRGNWIDGVVVYNDNFEFIDKKYYVIPEKQVENDRDILLMTETLTDVTKKYGLERTKKSEEADYIVTLDYWTDNGHQLTARTPDNLDPKTGRVISYGYEYTYTAYHNQMTIRFYDQSAYLKKQYGGPPVKEVYGLEYVEPNASYNFRSVNTCVIREIFRNFPKTEGHNSITVKPDCR